MVYRAGSGLREQLLDIFPVYEILDERLEIVGTAVAIVDVVGVLPDVAAEDRGGAVHQRAFAVGGLRDLDLAVLDREPAPARAELPDAAEVFVDLLFQPARQLAAAAIRLHPVPEMQMVVVLAGVIEHRRVLA